MADASSLSASQARKLRMNVAVRQNNLDEHASICRQQSKTD
jgi:hypothetical protein